MKKKNICNLNGNIQSVIILFVLLAVVGCTNKGKKQENAEEAKQEMQENIDDFLKLAKVVADADCIYDFSEGLAGFVKNGKVGVINKNGEIVVSPLYDANLRYGKKATSFDNAILFIDGMALVSKNSKHGFIDKNGKETISCTFDGANSFSEGYAVVRKGEKYGVIDKTGKQIVPYKYDNIGDFSDGMASVESNEKIGYINSKGEEIVPVKYFNKYNEFLGSYDFNDGLALIAIEDDEYGKFGYINKSGKEVIKPIYDAAGNFHNGLAAVKKGDMCGYVDAKGKEIIPLIYDKVSDFSDGIAVVSSDGKYKVIDKSGKEITKPIYTTFGDVITEGMAPLGDYDTKKYKLIDKKGKEIVTAQYPHEDIARCREGLIAIKKNDKWGFIDKTGKQITPCVYDEVKEFSDGYVVVQRDGIYGYLNKDGKCTLDIVDNDLQSIIANKKRGIDEKKRANELEKERIRKEQENRGVDNQAGGNVNAILYECQTEITAIQREIEHATRVFVSLASRDVDMFKYSQMKSTYVNGVDGLVKKADKAFDNCASKLKAAGITGADAKIKEEKRNFHSAIYELRTRATQQTDMSY